MNITLNDTVTIITASKKLLQCVVTEISDGQIMLLIPNVDGVGAHYSPFYVSNGMEVGWGEYLASRIVAVGVPYVGSTAN